jgi:hypothetical protein
MATVSRVLCVLSRQIDRRQEQGDGDSVDGWYQDDADEWTEWVFLRHVDVLSAGASSSRKHKGALRPLVRKTRATEGYPAIKGPGACG